MVSASSIIAAMPDVSPGKFYSVDELATTIGVQNDDAFRTKLTSMANNPDIDDPFKIRQSDSDHFYRREPFAPILTLDRKAALAPGFPKRFWSKVKRANLLFGLIAAGLASLVALKGLCSCAESKTKGTTVTNPSTASSNPTATASPTATAAASPAQNQSLSLTLPPPSPGAAPSQQKSDHGGISVGGDNNGQINGEGSHDNMFVGRPPPRDLSHTRTRQDLLDRIPKGEKFRIERVNDPETGRFSEEMKAFLVRNDRVFDNSDVIDLVGTFVGVVIFTKEQVKQGRGGDYYLLKVGGDDGVRGPPQPAASSQ